LLLAIIAFKLVVSDKLPAISYLTLIDYYVIGSFLLAFVTLVDHTLMHLKFYAPLKAWCSSQVTILRCSVRERRSS
jgi:hypothetical protein